YQPSFRITEEKSNPFVFTGGAGLLIDRAFAIDLAGEMSVSDYTYKTYGTGENRLIKSALVTFSYRY
ncbi:MAG: hypothetical protein JNL74_09260, partial [Fibrobacteres bacterium]|nr:hypothetical protein [Fibrobacterota bacterium]